MGGGGGGGGGGALCWSCFAVADPNMTPGRRGHSTLGGSFHPRGRMPPPPTHTHSVLFAPLQGFPCLWSFGGGGGGGGRERGGILPWGSFHPPTVSSLHHCRGFLAWGPLGEGGRHSTLGGHFTLRQCLLCTTAGVIPTVRVE